MYLNKIDEFIDKLMDDFYKSTNKQIVGFSKVESLLESIKTISSTIHKYMNGIDMKEIKKIINNRSNLIEIFAIFKTYLAYYLFLNIGQNYKKGSKEFISAYFSVYNNRKDIDFDPKDFFVEDNNAKIVKYTNIIQQIIKIMSSSQTEISDIINNEEYEETKTFLNSLGKSFVDSHFSSDNLSKNKSIQLHNIVKTLLLRELYFKKDRKRVFEILDAVEVDKNTYTYIEIVIQKTTKLDLISVENVLPVDQKRYAKEYYNFLQENTFDKDEKTMTINDKLTHLVKSKIILPIVDDFLLYHKDSEKYEKFQSESVQINKKKEDTKIKYIINKIDMVSDFYSDKLDKNKQLKEKTLKIFYKPLQDRRAILINEMEEIRILNKLWNLGRKTLEGHEYYLDLLNYRLYPYQPFRDFKTDGFVYVPDRTIDAIRYISFNDHTKKNIPIQYRIGSQDMTLNIVGLYLSLSDYPYQCLRSQQVKNIKKSQKSNGYIDTVKLLKRKFYTNRVAHDRYWIFDMNSDKIALKSYEQLNKFTNQEYIKTMIGKLYDDVMNIMFKQLYTKLDKRKPFRISEGFRMLENYSKHDIHIKKNSDVYATISKLIYETFGIELNSEDLKKKERNIPGITGDVVELPFVDMIDRSKDNILNVNPEKHLLKKDIFEEDLVLADAVCQHNISWRHLISLKRDSPQQFNDLLYTFMQQYAVINQEQEYVCKSCGYQLDIKKYVLDGEYNDEKGKFVIFNVPMEVPLEDIPEYAKYKPTIRNVDKIVERLASIANIPVYAGTSVAVKWRRKAIIKSTIDFVKIHNKYMKGVYESRINTLGKKYGISKELSNFFVFGLDNNIFMYSSKDKDYYKHIKFNNILVYIVLFMILELNESQIGYMGGDKTCNYYWFEKYGFSLFKGLKIHKNTSGDLDDITNYKVLCYLLYFMACLIAKYKVWVSPSTDPKKFMLTVPKIFIHTFVDMINGSFELSESVQNKSHIYEVISTKFFLKLNSLFKNEKILEKIRRDDTSKVLKAKAIRDKKISAIPSIKIKGKYKQKFPNVKVEYPKWTIPRIYVPQAEVKEEKYLKINNITNCKDGKFHKWVSKGKTFVCSNCNVSGDNLIYDEQLTNLLTKNYRYILLQKIAEKYCLDGDFHLYIYGKEANCNVCTKCKHKEIEKFTPNKLEELYRNVVKFKKSKNNLLVSKKQTSENKETERQKQSKEILSEIKKKYIKGKRHKGDYYWFLNKFVEDITHIIGKNVNIGRKNIYLDKNTFIIDHNYMGYKLNPPIIVQENEKKIKFKANHPHYKIDVFYYTNAQEGDVDVFYEAVSLRYLGYKEPRKDYVKAPNKDLYLKINYSVSDRLKSFGYNSHYINIDERIKKMEQFVKTEDVIMKLVISNINRKRTLVLKQIFNFMLRFVNNLKYGKGSLEIPFERPEEVKLFDKYKKKMGSFDITTSLQQFGNDWKVINDRLHHKFPNKTINVDITAKYLPIKDLMEYDPYGNLLLFYIIDQMSFLLKANDNKVTKTNLAYLILDLINHSFESINEEDMNNVLEMKRFSYILKSKGYLYDVKEKGHGLDNTEGIYSEYKDDTEETQEQIDQKLDDIEESQALDVDTEMDYEVDYEM